MIKLADIQDAQQRIAAYVRRTPLERNQSLSRALQTNVYLKMELFQKTGSFKPRAAFSKMLALSKEERERGVVAFSGGNFAQGVAYAGQVLGVKTRIVMPVYTPAGYIAATQSYGAEVELVPDISAAIAQVEQYRDQGWAYMHPFDDPLVFAGNGTLGLEIMEDIPNITDLILSVGGGGMMTGVVTAVKSLKPTTRIWTVETKGADAMAHALQAGKVVEVPVTSLARTLGAPHVAADALAVVQQQVTRNLVVNDEEAIREQAFLLERAKVLTELAASCTLAAARQIRARFSADNHVVLILCGGNVSVETLLAYHTNRQ
jgi:threonine dehydratase